jgi:hypothetical protein
MITSALFPAQFLLGRIGAKRIGLASDALVFVQVDAMVQEDHQSAATLTDYPIENGVSISDHVVVKPDQLTLNCVVSNTPIYIGPGLLATNRIMDAYILLWAIMSTKSAVNIVTGLRVYQNMVLEDLKVTRTKDNGQALEFIVQAKQARIVKTQTSTASAAPIAQKKVSMGGAVTLTDPKNITDYVNQVSSKTYSISF